MPYSVHQNGLVHISHLTCVFVKDPREVVKTGDKVKVKAIEIDVAHKRIALSMRLQGGLGRVREKLALTPRFIQFLKCVICIKIKSSRKYAIYTNLIFSCF